MEMNKKILKDLKKEKRVVMLDFWPVSEPIVELDNILSYYQNTLNIKKNSSDWLIMLDHLKDESRKIFAKLKEIDRTSDQFERYDILSTLIFSNNKRVFGYVDDEGLESFKEYFSEVFEKIGWTEEDYRDNLRNFKDLQGRSDKYWFLAIEA